MGTRSDSDMKTKRSDVPIDGLDSVTERRCEHIVLPSLRFPFAAATDSRYTPVVTFYDTHGFRHLISDQPTPPLSSSTLPAENPVAIDPQLVTAPRNEGGYYEWLRMVFEKPSVLHVDIYKRAAAKSVA